MRTLTPPPPQKKSQTLKNTNIIFLFTLVRKNRDTINLTKKVQKNRQENNTHTKSHHTPKKFRKKMHAERNPLEQVTTKKIGTNEKKKRKKKGQAKDEINVPIALSAFRDNRTTDEPKAKITTHGGKPREKGCLPWGLPPLALGGMSTRLRTGGTSGCR